MISNVKTHDTMEHCDCQIAVQRKKAAYTYTSYLEFDG